MNRRIRPRPRSPRPVKRSRWIPSLLLCLLASIPLPSAAEADLHGHAMVLAGDAVEIAGTHVQLFGVAAPALDQRCRREDGIEWRCGLLARRALENRIANRPLRCETYPPDSSGTPLATCWVEDAALGEWMVEQGWALAIGARYAGAQGTARSAGRGLWRDGFEPSAEWQLSAHLPYRPGEEEALDGCACAARHESLQRQSTPEAVPGD